MVICLERGAELHMAQLMPLPLTVSCFSKIQISFTFLVPADLGSPRKRAVKRACVRVLMADNLGKGAVKSQGKCWRISLYLENCRPTVDLITILWSLLLLLL